MDSDKLTKLVDAVIDSAIALDVHPDAVIHNLARVIPDEQERKAFVADIRTELVKIAHKLPWSL